jgi:hypothetical protein
MRIDFYSAFAGIVAGLGSALLFQRISARIPQVDFWLPAANLARSLVVMGDDDDFFSRYGALLKLLIRYLGRQALTMALPLAIVAVFAMLVLPRLEDHSDPRPATANASLPSPTRLESSNLRPRASEFTFFLPLCAGYVVALIVPRRKE